MAKARWSRLSTRDLRNRPQPLIEFYDQLTELCGPLGGKFDIDEPIDLVRRQHIQIYERLGGSDRRIELDERAVEVISEKCKKSLPHVTTESQVSRIHGSVTWVGKDPRGDYPKYRGWYARKIDGKMRARVMLKWPLVAPKNEDEVDAEAEEAKGSKKRKSRILSRLGRL